MKYSLLQEHKFRENMNQKKMTIGNTLNDNWEFIFYSDMTVVEAI